MLLPFDDQEYNGGWVLKKKCLIVLTMMFEHIVLFMPHPALA